MMRLFLSTYDEEEKKLLLSLFPLLSLHKLNLKFKWTKFKKYC